MRKVATAFVFLCAMSAGMAHANTYYTSTSGNDNYSCTQARSLSTPKRSINGGMGCLAAGDTLLVRGGTYDETFMEPALAGTSWTNLVRIANYGGETVWVTPTSAPGGALVAFSNSQQYVEFDGINFDARSAHTNGVIVISAWQGGNAHHIRFKNAEIISGGDGVPGGGTSQSVLGVLLVNDLDGSIGANEFLNLRMHGGGDPGDLTYAFYIQSDDNIIDGCDLYDQQGFGIQIYNSNRGGTPQNNIIRNSQIHDTTRTVDGYSTVGIMVSGAGTQIYNNLIWGMRNAGSESFGILLYGGGAANNMIYNNTLYDNQTYGIFLYGNTSGSVLKNNIIFRHDQDLVNNGTATVTATNLFGVDPIFLGDGSFRLKASSPAKDTGSPVTGLSKDFAGIARPQGQGYDIGAYEMAPVSAAPSAPQNVRITVQ